jgi:hypothetical protein
MGGHIMVSLKSSELTYTTYHEIYSLSKKNMHLVIILCSLQQVGDEGFEYRFSSMEELGNGIKK